MTNLRAGRLGHIVPGSCVRRAEYCYAPLRSSNGAKARWLPFSTTEDMDGWVGIIR
jgi:hypothetical protein